MNTAVKSIILIIALTLSSCHLFQSDETRAVIKESEIANKTGKIALSDEWILADPEIFDLGIDQKIFKKYFALHPPHQVPRDKIKDFVKNAKCHVQGLEIVDDILTISCCFYDAKNKYLQVHVGESFLLSTNLSDVLNKPKGKLLDWKIRAITSFVPPDEVERINQLLQDKIGNWFWEMLEDYRLKVFPNTTYDERPLRPILSHPSGMVRDRTGRIWNANSIYGGPGTYALIEAYDPLTLEKDESEKSIAIPEHVGWLTLFQDRFMVGETWDGKHMVVFDLTSGEYRTHKNPYRNNSGNWRELKNVGFGDCDPIDETYAICGGNWFENHFHSLIKRGLKRRKGKLYLVKGEGTTLDDFRLLVLHPIWIQLNQSGNPRPTTDFGKRAYRYKRGVGDIEKHYNFYGDYKSPLTLTNEGLALSPDKKSVYFLPEDIPGGKLIRYSFRKRNVK